LDGKESQHPFQFAVEMDVVWAQAIQRVLHAGLDAIYCKRSSFALHPCQLISAPGRNARFGLLWCIGQAYTTEAIPECIRGGGIGEAESNMGLIGIVSTTAAANRDAPLAVERIKF
jgi:hypothetical protein